MFGPTLNTIKKAFRDIITEEVRNPDSEANLLEEVNRLTREVEKKKIELDRVKENHSRENREIEHKLGLHKIQVEQEKDHALRDAKLTAREENMANKEKMLEERLKNMESANSRVEETLRSMLKMLGDRLPSTEIIANLGGRPNANSD